MLQGARAVALEVVEAGVLSAVAGIGLVLVVGRKRALALLVFGGLGALPAWPAVAHVGLFGDRYLLLPLAAVALAVAAALAAAAAATAVTAERERRQQCEWPLRHFPTQSHCNRLSAIGESGGTS